MNNCHEAKIDHRHHYKFSLIVPPELSLLLFFLSPASLAVYSLFSGSLIHLVV